jgi:UDP-glucose 4-epimerase
VEETMRVAVTGGRGFIGSYVCDELLKRGDDVVPVDRHDGLDILSDKTRDQLEHCDAVIHLAGVLGTDELFDDAEAAILVNVTGTYKVLRACADFGLKYVGITMPQCWENIYQATKLAAVKIARAFHLHYNVPITHVRAFNVFGPGQKVGKPQKIIPTFSHLAWRRNPLPIWGNGDQLVDLIYVNDVATVLVDALTVGGNDETIDAGTGIPHTVNEVAEMVLSIVDNSPPQRVVHQPMRRGEHGLGVRAMGEGWDLLGWKPRFRIEDLEKTVESYKS